MKSGKLAREPKTTLELKLREVHSLITELESNLKRLQNAINVDVVMNNPPDAKRLLAIARDQLARSQIDSPQSYIRADLERIKKQMGEDYVNRVRQLTDDLATRTKVVQEGKERPTDDPQHVTNVCAFVHACCRLLEVGGLEPAQQLRAELSERLAQVESADAAAMTRKERRNRRDRRLKELHKTCPAKSRAEFVELAKKDATIKALGELVTKDIARNAIEGRRRGGKKPR